MPKVKPRLNEIQPSDVMIFAMFFVNLVSFVFQSHPSRARVVSTQV